MTTAEILLAAAVTVGAAYILIGRLRRRQLPLLCGMGMIASSCVLERQAPQWLSLTVTLVWMAVPPAVAWRQRLSHRQAPDDATGQGRRDGWSG